MNALEKILAEGAEGEITFPTHADVAFRVRLALDDPELHVAKAAQIVQAEPLLAARVVAVAN
jgi:HD-like signal output (HDOD) protein